MGSRHHDRVNESQVKPPQERIVGSTVSLWSWIGDGWNSVLTTSVGWGSSLGCPDPSVPSLDDFEAFLDDGCDTLGKSIVSSR